jgi:hypothetical protein
MGLNIYILAYTNKAVYTEIPMHLFRSPNNRPAFIISVLVPRNYLKVDHYLQILCWYQAILWDSTTTYDSYPSTKLLICCVT